MWRSLNLCHEAKGGKKDVGREDEYPGREGTAPG